MKEVDFEIKEPKTNADLLAEARTKKLVEMTPQERHMVIDDLMTKDARMRAKWKHGE